MRRNEQKLVGWLARLVPNLRSEKLISPPPQLFLHEQLFIRTVLNCETFGGGAHASSCQETIGSTHHMFCGFYQARPIAASMNLQKARYLDALCIEGANVCKFATNSA